MKVDTGQMLTLVNQVGEIHGNQKHLATKDHVTKQIAGVKTFVVEQIKEHHAECAAKKANRWYRSTKLWVGLGTAIATIVAAIVASQGGI